MAAKKAPAERTPKQALADHFRKSETITPAEIAEIVDRDGKVVRGYLRKIKARDQSQLKNTKWVLAKDVAEQTVEYFTAAKRVASE